MRFNFFTMFHKAPKQTLEEKKKIAEQIRRKNKFEAAIKFAQEKKKEMK